MQKVKEIGGSVFGALCELLVGVLLLVNPTGFSKAIIVIVGIVLLVVGAANLMGQRRKKQCMEKISSVCFQVHRGKHQLCLKGTASII